MTEAEEQRDDLLRRLREFDRTVAQTGPGDVVSKPRMLEYLRGLFPELRQPEGE